MKTNTALYSLAIAPVLFAGTVALHPGVGFEVPEYAQSGAPVAVQQPGTYTVDPAHTSIGFEIDHLGLTNVHGRFIEKEGRIIFDPKDVTKSSVSFTIQTKSIDTAVAPRDEHLRSADFFEADKYPTITFRSTGVRKVSKGYVADGRLNMKGVEKPVSIPFQVFGPITDPWSKQRIGVVTEPIKLNRRDYGIAYDVKLPDGTPSVGDVVTVRLALEATKD